MFDHLPAEAAAALDAEVRRGARTGHLELAALTAIVGGAGASSAGLKARLKHTLAAAPAAWRAACTAPAVRLAAVVHVDEDARNFRGADDARDVRVSRDTHHARDVQAIQRASGNGGGPMVIACPRGLATVAAFGLTYVAHALSRGGANAPAPQVQLDAALAPQAAAARGRQRGEALLAAVAERGLAGRPSQLWLGPRVPAWALEPYLVHLAPQLAAHLGREVTAAATSPTLAELADLHRAATALAAAHPHLGEERRRAGESGGCWTLPLAGARATVVDLARVGPGHVHAAVGALPQRAPWPHPARAPVLVCVDWAELAGFGDVDAEAAALLARVLEGIGPQVRSLDVVLPQAPRATHQHEAGPALQLLRTLWVAGRASALALPPPPESVLAAVARRLHAAGGRLEVVSGRALPIALPAWTWPGVGDAGDTDDAGAPPAWPGTPRATVASGAALVEVALAARQAGVLSRSAPLRCVLGAPEDAAAHSWDDVTDAVGDSGATHAGISAWAAEVLADVLGVPGEAVIAASWASAVATTPSQPSVMRPDAAAFPAESAPASALPVRPTQPRHRGPLLKA